MQIFQHLMRSHSFKSELPPCQGVVKTRHSSYLLKRVCLFASYINRSGRGVYSECVAQTRVWPYIVAWPNVKVTQSDSPSSMGCVSILERLHLFSLFSMRPIWLVWSQHWLCVFADAWCKQAPSLVHTKRHCQSWRFGNGSWTHFQAYFGVFTNTQIWH